MIPQPLKPVPGHPGLLALPSEPEQIAIVARLALAARGGTPAAAHVPATPAERATLWTRVNEIVAEVQVDPDDGDAMARLTAALDLPDTRVEPEHPAAFEARRFKARDAVRHQCQAALAAGYTP